MRDPTGHEVNFDSYFDPDNHNEGMYMQATEYTFRWIPVKRRDSKRNWAKGIWTTKQGRRFIGLLPEEEVK